MRLRTVLLAATLAATLPASAFAEMADAPAQVGPRPFYLTDLLPDGELKSKLESCAAGPFRRSAFSIGHRGAPLQFPEHTRESYVAGARMGAGILECDVAFTKDKQLVCRHSQCDLHTTTNILDTPLAEKCSVPFSPASFRDGTEASAKCCTSDITLDEFRTLTGKMDASNKHAMTPKSYLGGTAGFRTDLYSAPGGQLMTHAESIALFRELGTLFTPELKSPSVEMPFDGMTQEDYAQSMVDEYKAAGIDPADVWLQSFNLDDVLYWVKNEPEFGKQAVYLDGRYDNENFDPMNPETFDISMADLKAQGVNVIAPPMWMLVTLDEAGKIVPSAYAKAAQDADLKMIAWTLERSGDLTDGGGWYFKSIAPAVTDGAAALELLDVLAQDVGVIGVFSDWPGTTTYYANCMGL